MKISVSYQKSPCQRQRPYLGIHKNDLDRKDPYIVMFIDRDYGFLVKSNYDNDLGHDSDEITFKAGEWDENEFEMYTGEVTLSN
jgi:hypothetical protein